MIRANIPFYFIFLSQIFLISYYFPQKMLGRMKSVLDAHPPSQYPKLYPKPIEHYRIGMWAFKVANRLIVVLGLIILVALVAFVDHENFADDGFISEAWPAAYGMFQFLPLVLLEYLGFRQLKLMRQKDPATSRKAELRRRRLFGFVSPAMFGATVLLYSAAIFLDLYWHQFILQWNHDTLQRAVILTAGNLFMAAVGAWHLYGRKLDPHQAFSDRARQITAQLKSLLYISMALSVFFMTAAADDVFALDYLDAILMSLYFQAIVLLSLGHLLRNLKLEDINFDVYRA